MSRPLPDRGRINPDCTATRHGTYSAYSNAGCRCPHAREDLRIYQKRLRYRVNRPKCVDSTGTRRRLQALSRLGWRWRDMGDRLGVSWQAVQNIALGRRELVHVDTVALVRALYRELCERPGPSRITARRAVAKGWHGPLAWADIDDPACQPDPAGPDAPVVDEWAVTEAMAGRLESSRLAEADVAEAVRRLLDGGLTRGQVRYRLRVTNAAVNRAVKAVGERVAA